jgi:hypothetical protein
MARSEKVDNIQNLRNLEIKQFRPQARKRRTRSGIEPTSVSTVR